MSAELVRYSASDGIAEIMLDRPPVNALSMPLIDALLAALQKAKEDPAVSAVIWSVIYRPDGLGNGVLERLGLPAQPFLTSPGQVLPSLIVLLSWIGVGYWMLFLIAGIQEVPVEVREAALLDGAGPWRHPDAEPTAG